METFLILLQHQQPLGERVAIGFLTGLFFTIVIALSNGLKKAKEKNKKDWDEVSKDETTKSNGKPTTDWEEIKKDSN